MRKSIFDVLKERKVNYAVGQGLTTFISKGVTDFARDYFIIIHKKQEHLVMDKRFDMPEDGIYPMLLLKDMTRKEIALFKSRLDQYDKTVKNSYGVVYELKEKSFKEYYLSVKNQAE